MQVDMTLPPWFLAPTASGAVHCTVRLPGSKSLTNRFLVLAALAQGTSVLRAPLVSRDTLLMRSAVMALGAAVTPADPCGADQWHVTPGAVAGPVAVDCGLSGTVMRFLPAVAALGEHPVLFQGDPAAQSRPMAGLLQGLRQAGVAVASVTDSLPFTVRGAGSVSGGTVTVDASASSQFVTGLLLAGARFDDGITVVHEGSVLPSAPHVTMTCEVLRDAGVVVDDSGANVWQVEPGPVRELDVLVEPDLSNAAAFLAAAVMTGGQVHVPGWPVYTTQAGDHLRHVLASMGAKIKIDRTGLTCTGPGRVVATEADLLACSELLPVLAALATAADGTSVFRGVGHVRGHETDRLAALATELSGVGATVRVYEDAIEITPGRMKPHRFCTYHDHRLAQAGCVVGLVNPEVQVENMATTAKTLPGFADMWSAMLGGAASVAAPTVSSAEVLAL